MRKTWWLAAAGAMFISGGLAVVHAEEAAEQQPQAQVQAQAPADDAQATIQDLKARIEALEQNQNTNTQALDTLKSDFNSASVLTGMRVGGHLKLYTYDRAQGTATKWDGTKKSGDTDGSAGFGWFILGLGKQLSEKISAEVQVEFTPYVSATPVLAAGLEPRSTAFAKDLHVSIFQAYLTAMLPYDMELKVGSFTPMYSEEYAKETWWHEQYHNNVGLDMMEQWFDSGIELYKNFDFEQVSLPVSLAILNGNNYMNGFYARMFDENESKSALIHVAPEFFNGRLRIPLSASAGKYDPADKYYTYRHAAGADFKYQKFNLSGEYLVTRWDSFSADYTNTHIPKQGIENTGYYVKAVYKVNPLFQAVAKYSQIENELDQSNMVAAEYYGKLGTTPPPDSRPAPYATAGSHKYDTLTFAADFNLTDTTTLVLQYSKVNAKATGAAYPTMLPPNKELDYDRFTLGWRVTF